MVNGIFLRKRYVYLVGVFDLLVSGLEQCSGPIGCESKNKGKFELLPKNLRIFGQNT